MSKHFSIGQGYKFGVFPAGLFSLTQVQCFLPLPLLFPSGMVMYIQCHYMLEVWNWVLLL